MSHVLAALFGGLGAGASSYGASRMREQDQERIAAQRMAELQQQEASRKALAQEQSALRIEQDKAKRAASVSSIRALFPNEKLPEGENWDADSVLDALKMRDQNSRFMQGQQGMADRLEKSLGGRLDQIEAQGRNSRGLAEFNAGAAMSRLLESEKGRNQRDATGTPKAQPTVQDFYTKMLGQQDEDGLPMSPEKAMAAAQRAYQVLTGTQAPARAPQQGDPREQVLMQRLSQAIQQINALDLPPEEKQARIAEANRRTSERARALRGGQP